MIEKLLEPYILVPFVIIGIFVASAAVVLGIALTYWLRDRISGVFVSKTGVQIHTNDVPVWSKIVDRIERIDSSTAKAIRKATTRLIIIDPETFGMSAEVMIVNRDANQPLVNAAYENHHTRELKSNADAYILDKAHDVFDAVQNGRKHFPELTYTAVQKYVCRWLETALLPNLRRACVEKVAFYNEQIERPEVSKTIKEILIGCRDKNLRYIECIDELYAQLRSNNQPHLTQSQPYT